MDKILALLQQLNKQNGSPIITIVSLALLLATSYYTSTSATRAIQDALSSLEYRVEAIEADRTTVPEWRTRSAITEEKVVILEEQLKEIKLDIREIRNFLIP